MISVILKDDTRLKYLISKIRQPSAFFKSWGTMVLRLAKRNALAHSKGGSFWPSIANQTRITQVSSSSVTIQCKHFAAWHKHHGGIVKAKNAKALTIPISPEAKGRRASEFLMGGVQLFVPRGTNVLGYASANGQFKGLYALRKSVTQAPEPWWPDDSAVLQLGLKEADFWINKNSKI